MKIILTILIALFTIVGSIAQSENKSIIIIQKFYSDTLKTNYRKVKFEADKKLENINRLDYSSAHVSDTITVKSIDTYSFENGSYRLANYKNKKQIQTNRFKKGDTIISEKESYITKSVFKKDKPIYINRIFPEESSIPYNELKYDYNENGDLIGIEETYNCFKSCENFMTVFEYKDNVVSQMTEFKLIDNKWRKQKVWDYELITEIKLSKKDKKRINLLLLENQFLNPPW